MKKMLVMVHALGLMLTGVTAVLAGGDKNRGEVGQGDTHEIGCEDQPCTSYEDAPKPGSSASMIMTTDMTFATQTKQAQQPKQQKSRWPKKIKAGSIDPAFPDYVLL